ncbi:splicing factor Cactin-like [Pyrus communis]|uniref:splicing factor Cactin-like n=1 Tax=Pyrus communis TaxID=23211 RepID=UPI0035BF663D
MGFLASVINHCSVACIYYKFILQAEIEKVKKRREERALEKAQHEEEMALLIRDCARAEFQDWEKKEEELHFDQSKVRSEITVREGVIKPINVLSKHLSGSDDFEIEIDKPCMVFMGLTVKEMEELRDDIKMHLDRQGNGNTCEVLGGWKKDAIDRAKVRGEEPPFELLAEQRGLHTSIEADVKNLLEGKTFSELEELQSKIESEMHSGTAKVVEYWEAVLTRLHIFKAKACLKEIHAKMLHKHLERLVKWEDGEMNLDRVHDSQPEEEKSEPDVKDAQTFSPEPMEEEIHVAEEEAGSFSPELLHGDENEEVIDPEEDKAILERKRVAVLEEQQRWIQEATTSKPAPPEDNFEKVMKFMGDMVDGDAV